jgi:hypothetical protein
LERENILKPTIEESQQVIIDNGAGIVNFAT